MSLKKNEMLMIFIYEHRRWKFVSRLPTKNIHHYFRHNKLSWSQYHGNKILRILEQRIFFEKIKD